MSQNPMPSYPTQSYPTRSYRLTSPASKLSLRATALLAASAFAALSCGSDSKDDSGTKSNTVIVPLDPPCSNELAGQCGSACTNDNSCSGGQFCQDGACFAECTRSGGQCNGTCSAQGRCDGEVKTTVSITAPVDTGSGLIVPGAGTTGVNGPACATGGASANLANVDMFIMFDQSYSMRDNNRWDNATAALIAFLQDPQTAGLKIALRFFGSDEPAVGCNITACNIDACSQPLIELGELTAASGAADAQEQRLVSAIQSRQPNEPAPGTPISAALQGAVNWALDFNTTAPDTERAVVVFVTDGEPTGCERDTNTIAAIAGRGYDQGVTTFAVGLQGSSTQQINAIANQGGSGQGIFVGDGNAETDLLNALNAIRGRALACDFPLPKGQNIDPNKINVTFTTESGTATQWNNVTGEGACGNTAGWYYDNPTTPTSVILCPAACTEATASPGAKLDVVLGCQTNVPITR